MRSKLVVAVVSVCAAAGVVTYDVNYFFGAKPGARTPSTPPAAPGDGTPASMSPSATSANAASDAGPHEGSATTAPSTTQDFDFKSLFDQLAARDAERAAQQDAATETRSRW